MKNAVVKILYQQHQRPEFYFFFEVKPEVDGKMRRELLSENVNVRGIKNMLLDELYRRFFRIIW